MACIFLHFCFSGKLKHLRGEALMADEWSVLQHHGQPKAGCHLLVSPPLLPDAFSSLNSEHSLQDPTSRFAHR